MKKVLFLFGELNDLDIEWLISRGKKNSIASGVVLIEQGKPADALYIVLEGEFTVSVSSKQDLIGTLGAGEVIGEMSFIDSRPPSTSVRAAVNSVVYSIPRSTLTAKLKEDTAFAARFYRALSMFLSHRLRRLTLRMAEGNQAAQSDTTAADELDGQVLDGIYLAGQRFQRVLKGLPSS